MVENHGAMQMVENELNKATKKFGPFNSMHEGYGIILEELDELWEEIKSKDRDMMKIEEEAIQVAAMATRFVVDLGRMERR